MNFLCPKKNLDYLGACTVIFVQGEGGGGGGLTPFIMHGEFKVNNINSSHFASPQKIYNTGGYRS